LLVSNENSPFRYLAEVGTHVQLHFLKKGSFG
jgi:hypothetical protein